MTAFAPTAEQSAIVDAARTGQTVAIEAGAGTGKTSTLRLIAQDAPNKRFLYLAFNKAIQTEAAKSFPSNVEARTGHSLAYRNFGAPMRGRLNGKRMTSYDNARILSISYPLELSRDRVLKTTAVASAALQAVARFCRSADIELAEHHVPRMEGLDSDEYRALAHQVLPYAQAAWSDLTSEGGSLKPTHDVYLKTWALSEPQLPYDAILYDEAQDADECIAGVVSTQSAQLVAVGDKNQAIYGWRGARDHLSKVDARHRLRLTHSWRFGQRVADEGNAWLEVLGSDMRISGNPGMDSTIAPVERPDAVLCRSNAGTVEQLMDAHNDDVSVCLQGGGQDIKRLAEAAGRMKTGHNAGHPDLAVFSSWDEVVEYAREDPSGSDLAVSVRMIEKFSPDTIIGAIDQCVPADRAQLVVTTAHKAKGLEWGNVRIASDFRQPVSAKGEPLPVPDADAMLAYVSVTRAKQTLDNTGLAWIDEHMDKLGTPLQRTTNAVPPAQPVVVLAPEDGHYPPSRKQLIEDARLNVSAAEKALTEAKAQLMALEGVATPVHTDYADLPF